MTEVVKVDKVVPGYDDTGKHTETMINFDVEGLKIVEHCYNTTQKLKVEGKGYINFVDRYLVPHFMDIIYVGTENS